MSKMTFVVDYPDGQNPSVGFATDILGGQLVSVAFGDMREQWAWQSVDVEPPCYSEVLVCRSDGSVGIDHYSEHTGWFDDDEDHCVTHWMSLPEPVEDNNDA